MDNCVFCQKFDESRVIYEDSLWIGILDGFPVSEGHTLLIPKRHCETYFDLGSYEAKTIHEAVKTIKDYLDETYHPNGYNIGINCGEASGQTVKHCHIHIIPRYDGDVENPRGGVRGCIPSRMNY